jgi:three-Cys-motif partner protein
MVTKHGTYIDGFAGPQEEDLQSENWSARLVLRLRPQWLKRFILIEQQPEQVERIYQMLRQLPRTPLGKKMRNIKVIPGDVNVKLPAYLADYPIRSREATFCLLDQRTFECHWSTVETVARHKRNGNKIEIFYFLANSWINRSVANTRDFDRVAAWWGKSNWKDFLGMGGWDRALSMRDRFQKELGYRYALPLPIYDRHGGRRIMYFMIHATDHPDATKLMSAAYDRAVEPLQTQKEIQLFLQSVAKDCTGNVE